jgi:hypothetical protein
MQEAILKERVQTKKHCMSWLKTAPFGYFVLFRWEIYTKTIIHLRLSDYVITLPRRIIVITNK